MLGTYINTRVSQKQCRHCTYLLLLEFALVERAHPLLGLQALERALISIELEELLDVLIDELRLLRLLIAWQFRRHYQIKFKFLNIQIE